MPSTRPAAVQWKWPVNCHNNGLDVRERAKPLLAAVRKADSRIVLCLQDRAPTLGAALLMGQSLFYGSGWLAAWAGWSRPNEAVSTAVGVLLICAALFVATGVSGFERRGGHDGWWWGFGVVVLGPLGLLLWLPHVHASHGWRPALPGAQRRTHA